MIIGELESLESEGGAYRTNQNIVVVVVVIWRSQPNHSRSDGDVIAEFVLVKTFDVQ